MVLYPFECLFKWVKSLLLWYGHGHGCIFCFMVLVVALDSWCWRLYKSSWYNPWVYTACTLWPLLRHDIVCNLIMVLLDSNEQHVKHLAFALPVQLPVPDRSPGRRWWGARVLLSHASGGRGHLLLPAPPPQEPGAGGWIWEPVAHHVLPGVCVVCVPAIANMFDYLVPQLLLRRCCQ